MTLVIENASDDLLKAIKAMAKPFNAKVKIKKSSMDRALKEAQVMAKNPHKYKSYSSAKELIKDCLDD
ncbi:hypothetical protein [Campylobacter sp. VTCC 70190]|uniref:hypothetical protein n=1 Tax=Campylobacter sp. VTCC 70190 TaxID=3392118 RepID=UPI00398F6614